MLTEFEAEIEAEAEVEAEDEDEDPGYLCLVCEAIKCIRAGYAR